ncbi:hypothetical protein [Acuticoccus sp. I52.16.1]|uniref:hypothetical protein n=1 Tax=Acuticoccus sp. I52.16.1 TaxID=2928472 RepID=UPI001FD4441C|nr:hypothetical protein [Acuticoccus sp. I52.16.1]UOM36490.1 hypothetical protein MRB58_10005 [Acuticoccus sp. I52.16.1]
MSGPDWRAILTAQGIDPAVVDQAEETAAALATVAAALPHAPSEAAAPLDIMPLLIAGREDT